MNNTPGKTIPAAYFYHANLAPFPKNPTIAKEYLQACPEARLRSGLEGLYNLIRNIYQSAVQSPQDFVFPKTSPLSGKRTGLTDPLFVSIPHLIYLVGIGSVLVEDEGRLSLSVEPGSLAERCKAAKIKDYESVLGALVSFGMEARLASPLNIHFSQAPETAAALPVFARACQYFVKKETQLPLEFGRVDLRVLAYPPGKKKSISVGAGEAIRLLEEPQAGFIAGLDAWASAAGYRAETKVGALHNASWRVNYHNPRLGKALFGFTVDGGCLAMHINFNDTRRILPHIFETPRTFQDVYFSRCACADCGACQDGPVRVEFSGKVHRICGFSYLNLPEVPFEFFKVILTLLKAQDAFLKQDAGL